ncbi:MAG: DUF4340 domain-containing protein [Planctomycetes bacterium]|nr:DUF4340 domain-containing protein [Planctomycetota bacterium]
MSTKSAVNFRTTWIMIGAATLLLGVFAIYVFWGDDRRPNKEGYLFETFKSLKIQPNEIDGLEIEKGSEKLVFMRRPDGRWRMHKPIEGRADSDRVEAIVRELLDSRREEKAADITDDMAIHGLDNPPVKISLKSGTRTATMSLGKSTIGGDSAVMYVLTSDDPKLVQATRINKLRSLFKEKFPDQSGTAAMIRDVNDFRTLALLGEGIAPEGAASQLLSIKLSEKLPNGERIVALSRENPERSWRFEIPPGYGDIDLEEKSEKSNPKEIYNLLSLLINTLNIKVPEMKDYLNEAKDLAALGLDPNGVGVLRVDIKRQDGIGTETLWISKDQAKDARDKVYVRYDGDASVAQVNAEIPRMLRRFLDDPSPLRDRTLVKLRRERVDALDVTIDKKTFELRKIEGRWKVRTGMKEYEGNPSAIETLIFKLAEPKQIRGFLSADVPDKELGLDPPSAEVAIWEEGLSNSKKIDAKEPSKMKDPTVRLQFGKKEEGKSKEDKADLVIVRRISGLARTEMKVPAELLDLASRGLLEYVNLPLASFNPDKVEKFSFLRNGVTWEIERDLAKFPAATAPWTVVAPAAQKGKLGNAPEIVTILDSYRNLKSDKVIAESASNEQLISWGLDPAKPVFKFSLQLQDDPALRLMILGIPLQLKLDERVYFLGNAVGKSQSAYTKTNQSDFIFESPIGRIDLVTKARLIDPTLYRVEPGQLTMKVSWIDPKTMKPEVLELERKEGSVWKAKGDRKIDELRVEEFFGNVSRPLTVEQVVEKTGPKPEHALDLKSGALEVEIAAGAGKPITLSLGGVVDKSGKLIYVMSNQSPGDVYILDATRLLPVKENPAGVLAPGK